MNRFDEGYSAYWAMQSRDAWRHYLDEEEGKTWLDGFEHALLVDSHSLDGYEEYYEGAE